MYNRILALKLRFLYHLATLPETSLGRDFYEIQSKHNLPSIVTQCGEYLAKWGVSDIRNYTKVQFKKLIRKKMLAQNLEDLLDREKGTKKVNINDYNNCEFKLKEYFKTLNLNSSRMIFRRNSHMLKTVRSNFKSDKRYKAEGFLCPDCLAPDPPISHQDTQEALATCQGNRDLRQGLDLSQLKQEADFYQSIIARRIQKFGG